MRFDAYKVCKVRRRPLAKRTGGIGVWEHLLNLVTVIGVLTNCWIVAFFHTGSRELLESFDSSTGTVFLVVAWEHLMLFIKYLMGNMISSLPKGIRDEIREKQHETENQRYENMRLKTEQTRRLKREKSISGSFRLLSVTPDSVSRVGSNEQDSHMTTPGNCGRLQTIESFEGQIDDRSTSSSRAGEPYNLLSGVGRNAKNLDGGYTIPHTSIPETSAHLRTNGLFEESLNESSVAKSESDKFYVSVPTPQRDLVHLETENEADEIPLEESFNENSFIDSKPGELFEC